MPVTYAYEIQQEMQEEKSLPYCKIIKTRKEIENYSLENSVLITYIQTKTCFSLEEVTKLSVTISFILFSLLRAHFALYKAELNLSIVSLLTSKSPPSSFKINTPIFRVI